MLFLTADVNDLKVASYLQLQFKETLKIGAEMFNLYLLPQTKRLFSLMMKLVKGICRQNENNNGGEWRFNPSVLRAKGDRSVRARALPVGEYVRVVA